MKYLCVLIGVWSAACAGQTGQEGRDPQCATAGRTPVAAGDEIVGGISADALVANVRGPWKDKLRWDARNSLTDLELSIDGDAQSARAVRRMSSTSGGTCGEELEISAEVRLVTSDGLLDETVSGTVRAVSPDNVTISAVVKLDAVQGRYDASEFDLANWKDPELQAIVYITDGRRSGQLSLAGADPSPNDGETPVAGSVASWPAR